MTGTVESIPLIASSIMSKKIAEGTAALVLDVKVGSGAFMREEPQARLLAQTMVTLGAEHGVATSALLTRMDTPLGRAVGNAVEVEEAVATLRGEGPPDLVEVTLALAREMLRLAGIDADPAAALADGRALDAYRAMIRAQGGDPDAPLPAARHTRQVLPAPRRSAGCSGSTPGRSGWPPGGSAPGGRSRRIRSARRPACCCLAKPGERVERGQPLLELLTDDESRFGRAAAALAGAVDGRRTAAEVAAAGHRSSVTMGGWLPHSRRSGPFPRCCCTTTWMAACGRPRWWTWPVRSVTTSCRPRTWTRSSSGCAAARTAAT